IFIGDRAFKGDRNLKRVRLSPNTLEIGAEAFAGCVVLEDIVVPQSILEIGAGAFDGCLALADGEGYIMLGGACHGNVDPSLTDVRVPDRAESVAPGAFREKKNIRFVTVPPSVTRVGPHAFAGCSGMREITLPASVHDLGAGPFDGCDALESIVAPGMGPEDFEGEDRLCAVLGYCRRPEVYSSSRASAYEDWIQDEGHALELLSAAIERNMSDAMRFFALSGHIPPDVYPQALDRAQRARRMEIVAILLDYRQNIPNENPMARFSI
ncbi:MAG: leucine-rich repeat domain-containing protein, partial [Fretibacterium sp.]|nr:leucine-rich repeat domain-containing protein [Fretibacterium sp.]